MKKIKITYLITGLHTGGAEMIIYRMLKTALEQDYDDEFKFQVISIVPTAEIGDKIKELGIEVKSLNAESKSNPLIAWRLYSLLRQEQPDILHTFLFHANVLGRIIGKIAGVPKIVSAIRNEYFGNKLREKILKITKHLCDHTTVVSEYTAGKMIEKGVIAEKNYKVITNGVDIEALTSENKKQKQKIKTNLNLDKKDPVLVSVGSLTEQKGFSYLIKAIDKLKEKYEDIFLMILGSGPKQKELKQLIQKLDLQQEVELVGRKDNVKDYLQLADIFMLSSLWEGMPNALLEAQAVGLPSVATRVSGISEIIDDGENGVIVEPNSEGALISGIETILDQIKEDEGAIKTAAQQKIKQEFSLESMTEDYISFYKNLAKKK
jgi:glycosyltransferase involved in cell wall biosynthesis